MKTSLAGGTDMTAGNTKEKGLGLNERAEDWGTKGEAILS